MAGSVVDEVQQAARAIQARCSVVPRAGIVPGTGLEALLERLSRDASVQCVLGGVLQEWVIGRLAGTPVVVPANRWRASGFQSMEERALPVRVAKALGARTVVLTASAWALGPGWKAGDVVGLVDHINATGDSPLVGTNDEELGPRFPDMGAPYSASLLFAAGAAAACGGIPFRRGVYAGWRGVGPGTADDRRTLRALGADVAGAGIVPEALAAVHAGMEVVGLAVVAGGNAANPAELGTMVEKAEEGELALAALVEALMQRVVL